MSDWDQRLLCADGACVGVIGSDGRCKVCGRAAPNWGDDRRRGLKTTGDLAASPAVSEPGPDEQDLAEGADDEDSDEADDEIDETADDEAAGDEDDGDEDDEDDGEDGDDDDDDEDGDDEDDDEDEDIAESEDSGVVHAQAPAAPPAVKPGKRKGAGAPETWDDRRLCPDGACVGVLGDDGACKTCGARA